MKPHELETRNSEPGTRVRAFTLMEVMFAVMILGVGLIAIAGVLPVAGVLHRNTIDESEALAIGKTARAVLLMRGVASPGGTGMQPIKLDDATYPLPLIDRAYPAVSDSDDDYHTRHRYYWVPLALKPTTGQSRQVFVFVMRNPEYSYDMEDKNQVDIPATDQANPKDGDINAGNFGGDAPRVIAYDVNTTDPNILEIPWNNLNDDKISNKLGFGAGVRILDNNGTIHVIQSIGDNGNDLVITLVDPWPTTLPDPSRIWFALADINDPNPTLHIAAMGGQAVLK